MALERQVSCHRCVRSRRPSLHFEAWSDSVAQKLGRDRRPDEIKCGYACITKRRTSATGARLAASHAGSMFDWGLVQYPIGLIYCRFSDEDEVCGRRGTQRGSTNSSKVRMQAKAPHRSPPMRVGKPVASPDHFIISIKLSCFFPTRPSPFHCCLLSKRRDG